jgi:hypothetical protein
MKLIQSYVANKYFVSTIKRQSSMTDQLYAMVWETMAWNWNPVTRQTEQILPIQESTSCKEGAFKQHFDVCMQLEETGEYKEDED